MKIINILVTIHQFKLHLVHSSCKNVNEDALIKRYINLKYNGVRTKVALGTRKFQTSAGSRKISNKGFLQLISSNDFICATKRG